MNEDEAIKRLQEILDFKKNTIDKIEDPIEREIEENCYIEEMPFEAIETILDLYQQEKEKNKELTDFIEAIDELKQAKKPITDLVYEMNKFEDEFISKDKIRGKLEYATKMVKFYITNESDHILIPIYNEVIKVCKELLEEE